jgi:hypothetical protein
MFQEWPQWINTVTSNFKYVTVCCNTCIFLDHCRSQYKGREGLPFIHSFIHPLNCEFLCIYGVSLTDKLTESALGFEVNVTDIYFQQCINSEFLVKLKMQPSEIRSSYVEQVYWEYAMLKVLNCTNDSLKEKKTPMMIRDYSG